MIPTLPPEIAEAIDDVIYECLDEGLQAAPHRGEPRVPKVATARARLEALIAGLVEWQPIETAPKDGTSILLAGGEDDNTSHVQDCELDFMRAPCRAKWAGCCWLLGIAEAGYVGIERYNPTHWRPLPHPPSTQAKDGNTVMPIVDIDPQLIRILSLVDKEDGSLTFEPDEDHFVALPGLERALSAGLVRLDHGSGWGLEKVDVVLTRKGKDALGYPPGLLWRIWLKLFPKTTALCRKRNICHRMRWRLNRQ